MAVLGYRDVNVKGTDMQAKSNIIIHMGASVWTAKVRGADGKFVEFNLRAMDGKQQHNFRRELVKAFREAGLS
jgi:hypothetical protein